VGLLNETLLHSVAGDPGESNEKVHVLWRGSREEKIKSTIEAYKKSGDKTIKGAGKDLLHPIQDANYHVSKYTFGPGLGHGLFPEADLAVGEKTFDEFYQVVTDTQEGVKLAKERGAFGNHSHPALKKEISKQKWEKIYTDLKAIERKYEFIFKLLNIIGIGSHLGPVMGSLGGMGGGIVGAVIGGIGGFFVGLFTGKNVLKGMESGAKIGFKIGFNSLQAIVGGIAGYGAGLLMPIAKDRLRIKVAGEQDNYLKEKRSQIQEES
jgi:hypothetical protein